MDKNTAVNYAELESLRAQEVQAEMQKQLAKAAGGRIDSLRHTILRYVVEGNYDMAHSEIDRFVGMQRRYPPFLNRTSAYIKHCHDVINAVKAKRSLPGLGGLSMSKHQELFEKVLEHFEELKHFLLKIEIVEKEVKLDDLRSTVWVVKALFHCLFVIVLAALVQNVIFGGLADNFNIVMDDFITRLLNRVFEFF